jgi:hypothetical protein
LGNLGIRIIQNKRSINYLPLIILLGFLAACAGTASDKIQEPINILFIGDRFTSWTKADLSEMFTKLAEL